MSTKDGVVVFEGLDIDFHLGNGGVVTLHVFICSWSHCFALGMHDTSVTDLLNRIRNAETGSQTDIDDAQLELEGAFSEQVE